MACKYEVLHRYETLLNDNSSLNRVYTCFIVNNWKTCEELDCPFQVCIYVLKFNFLSQLFAWVWSYILFVCFYGYCCKLLDFTNLRKTNI